MENASVIFLFCAMWGGAILPRPRHLAMVCVRSSTAATVVAATAAIAATTIVAATAAPVSAATAAAQDDQDDDDPQAAAAAPTATVKPHNEVPPDLDVGPPLAASLHLMYQVRFGSALQKFRFSSDGRPLRPTGPDGPHQGPGCRSSPDGPAEFPPPCTQRPGQSRRHKPPGPGGSGSPPAAGTLRR